MAFSAGGADLHTAAHEAAHVVQQRGGVALKDGVGAPGDRYEQHADAVADRVVQGRSAEGLLDPLAGSGGGAPGVQAKLGRYDPGSIVATGWTFWQKAPSIQLDGGVDFFKSSKPVVVFGSLDEIAQNVDNMKGRKMFVSYAHEIYGQDFDEYDDTVEPTFVIGVEHREVEGAAASHSLLMDPGGMATAQIVNGVAGMAGAGLGSAFGGPATHWAQHAKELAMVGIDAADARKTHKETREGVYPKSQAKGNGQKFHVAIMTPSSTGNSRTFKFKPSDVKRGPNGELGVWIDFGAVADLFPKGGGEAAAPMQKDT